MPKRRDKRYTTPPGRTLLTILLCSLCWLVVSLTVAAAEEPRKSSVLRWSNGDSLVGGLHSANEKELAWDSPLFDSPLRLRLDQLHAIMFPVSKQISDEVPTQIIETIDGNRLYGDVTEINDESVSIETKLFGFIKLRRAAVRRLSNPMQRSHVYSGPDGLAGWSTRTYGRKLSEWDVIKGGGLSTNTVAAELYRPLDAGGSIEIDMDVQWRKNPSFQIHFLTPFASTTKETVQLVTRAGGYVLQTLSSSGKFEQLEELSKRSTRFRLLLRWSQTTQELTIYRDKTYVGKMEVTGNHKPGTAGLYIKNTGPHLTLSRLEINGSSTLRSRSVDPTTDFVLLTDDKSVQGRIQRMETNTSAITIRDANGTDSQLPWSEIAEVSFRTAAVDQPVKKDRFVDCLFHDGEVLRGEISMADADGVMLQIPAADRPVRCPLRRLERIVFNQTFASAPANAPQIRVGHATLHGQLVGFGPDQAMGWLPVGGLQACRLTSAKPARVILDRSRVRSLRAIDEDLIYLRSGDLIPCRVESVDEQQVTLETKFAGKCKVANDALKAIELVANPFEPIVGFGDAGWKSNRVNNITQDEHKVTFTGPATWRNENILKGDQIEFDLSWSSKQSSHTVQIMLLGGKQVRRQAISLHCIQNQFLVVAPGNGMRAVRLPASDVRPPLQMRISKMGAVQLSANGKEVYRLSSLGEGGWTGIEFKVVQNGFAVRPRGVAVRLLNRKKQIGQFPAAELTISNFRLSKSNVGSGSLALTLQDAGPLLTVPRSRRGNPAKHLLVGINDDLVRGDLLFLDRTTLRFRSRLEELNLPRGAVAGVIWLEDEKPDSLPNPRHPRIVLRNGSTISVTNNRLHDGAIVGEHPELGRCRLPLTAVREILIGEIDNPPQAYAYSGWRTRPAPEPRFAAGAAGEAGSHSIDSPLVGKLAKDFRAPLLGDQRSFRLSRYREQVVVLDFWATWCAPCTRSMPGLIDMVDAFPADQVCLIAINQQEDDETVRAFRAARGWQLTIGLDPLGQIGQQFGVESIPQTVVVDQEGKVAQVFVGASPDLHTEIRDTIERLLQAP